MTRTETTVVAAPATRPLRSPLMGATPLWATLLLLGLLAIPILPGSPSHVAAAGHSSGASASSLVAVDHVTASSPAPRAGPAQYQVNVSETGLPAGTSWSVTLNGTTQVTTANMTTFLEPNGTYAWTVASVHGSTPVPSSGSVVVAGPLVFPVLVNFPPAGKYLVTFNETGLPSGAVWSVNYSGMLNRSSFFGSNITYTMANGTATFIVTPVGGYNAYPPLGSVTVSGANVVVVILFAPPHGLYAVTFSQSGLFFGVTSWSVTFNGTTQTTSPRNNLLWDVRNGTYTFTVGTVPGYTASPTSGSITINGNGSFQVITYTAIPGTSVIAFREQGLPTAPATNWTVVINSVAITGNSGSFRGTIFFNELVGTYAFSVLPVPGYTASPSHGNVTVATNGTQYTVTIAFLLPGQYVVAFPETGLPAFTRWSVTLGTTTTRALGGATNITFIESAGTYAFSVPTVVGYTPNPSTGSATVASSNLVIPIVFTPPSFPATFTETGLTLLGGASWSVIVNGTSYSSTTSTITVGVTNGTHPYQVPIVGHWVPTPTFGNLTVAGSANTVGVVFVYNPYPLPRYTAMFSGTGLPTGTTWSLTFNGSSVVVGSSFNVVNFTGLLNGTYGFVVASVAGYTVSPTSGSVVINGGNQSQTIAFTRLLPPPPTLYFINFTETGLPSGTSWSVAINGSAPTTQSSVVQFHLKDGTYAYTVNAPTGYTATPASGNVVVSSAATSVSVAFASSGGNGGGGGGGGTGSNGGLLGGSTLPFLLVGVVVVVAVLLVAFLLMRKRRGPAATAPKDGSSASGGSSWAQGGASSEPGSTSSEGSTGGSS